MSTFKETNMKKATEQQVRVEQKDTEKVSMQKDVSKENSKEKTIEKKNYVAFANLVKDNNPKMNYVEIAQRKIVEEDVDAVKILIAYDVLNTVDLIKLIKIFNTGSKNTAARTKIKQLLELAACTKGLKKAWSMKQKADGTVRIKVLKNIKIAYKIFDKEVSYIMKKNNRF